jgi:tRNA-splicing ligase RtcB
MGRNDATRNLEFDQCEKDMEGIVFRRWSKIKRGKLKGKYDLGEAVGAYKDIDAVMENQKDLVEIVTKLRPLAVVKG